MASIKFALKAEMEDGKTYEVTADQRDLAKWEAHSDGKGILEYQHAASRFLAWSALTRQAKLKMGWEKFSDQCVEVTMPGDDEDNSKSS